MIPQSSIGMVRALGAAPATLIAAVFLAVSCRDFGPSDPQHIDDMTITARPGAPTSNAAVGLTPLGVGTARDGFLYLPAGYDPATPAPLLIMAHGEVSDASIWSRDVSRAMYDTLGLVVLGIDSRNDLSWDVSLTGRYGPDVAFLNQALAKVFSSVNVDPNRIAIGGFGDGASWALGVGIANGDVISAIIAFSPGGLFGPFRRGEPKIFVSHGTEDAFKPFIRTEQQLVPILESVFPDVIFVQFTGGHEIPLDIERQAYDWFLK
jgi:phospholipase/carboxylesterase